MTTDTIKILIMTPICFAKGESMKFQSQVSNSTCITNTRCHNELPSNNESAIIQILKEDPFLFTFLYLLLTLCRRNIARKRFTTRRNKVLEHRKTEHTRHCTLNNNSLSSKEMFFKDHSWIALAEN